MKRFFALLCCLMLCQAASAEICLPADSSHYDSKLALQLLDISSLCFETEEQEEYLSLLGFACAGINNYEPHETRHVAAYGVYTGKSGGRDAVLVSVRGTGEGEWPLNIELMPSGDYDLNYAENFYLAAQDILQSQSALFEALERPLFLITGHSRGAAVGNILAALLSDLYGCENVYAYTVATPRTVRGEKKSYPNIFNLINPADYVTYMPLPQWGFERYGTDVLLPADPQNAEALRETYAGREDTFGIPFSLFRQGAEMTQRMIAEMALLSPTAEEGYTVRHSLNGPGLAGADEEGMTAGELMMRLCTVTAGSVLPLAFDLARMKVNYTDFDPLLNTVMEMVMSGEIMAMACAHTPALYAALLCEDMQ